MWTITVHVYELCKCYTIMYNDNNVMYYEQMHDLYKTGNTFIIALNSI